MVYTDAGGAGEQLASVSKLSGGVLEVSGGTVQAYNIMASYLCLFHVKCFLNHFFNTLLSLEVSLFLQPE